MSPDMILVVGDMLNADCIDSHEAVDVTKGLSSIAPVYYVLGNHEINYTENMGENLIAELENTGAKVLELEDSDIDVKGD